MVQEQGNPSLKQKLDKTIALLEGSKGAETKDFKLPNKIGFGIKNKVKNNYCIVQTIGDNGNIDFKVLPIQNNMIYIKETDTWHMATANYILRYKNYPMIIQPTFDSEPYSLKQNFEGAFEEGRLTTFQRFYINVMNLSQIKPKTSMDGKTILIIGILAIVAIAFIMSKVGGG